MLQLLDRLKKENITYAEMDEIGNLLHKAGRSAVQPLLRKLWREKNGTLISKYTYLLDFLDDNYWFDQIIQIALKRRDLELEGKSAILATLEDCGVDVTLPPFSIILSGKPVPLAESFSLMMEKGEEGRLWFLEDFAGMPAELKRPTLLELTRVDDPCVLEMLQLLLWYDDPEVAGYVVEAIGRVRKPEAAALLEEFRQYAGPELQQKIDQSIRRLAFVGVKLQKTGSQPKPMPFHSAYAGPLDGSGYRHLWLARWRQDGGIDSVDMQLHDVTGVKGVWGESGEPVEEYERRSSERVAEELVEEIAPEYALQLICDGLYRTAEEGYLLPPEFMLRRNFFSPEELKPAPYEPSFSTWPVKVTPRLLAQSAQLFEDEFFAGWCLATCSVYDAAGEWLRLEEACSEDQLSPALERLIEKFCKEEFQPRLQEISRRLFLNADYFARTGIDGEIVKMTLATAESLENFALPSHLHPFLRRYAMESMIAAREAMAEGYDMRDHPEDENWE